MCTFEHNPRIRLSKEEEITVYKVFGKNYAPPLTFNEDVSFKFGKNIWNKRKAKEADNLQSGFQVFAKKKDAEIWKKINGHGCELVCPIIIKTKDIVKATNEFKVFTWSGPSQLEFRVYEVSSFVLWKKDWKKAVLWKKAGGK